MLTVAAPCVEGNQPQFLRSSAMPDEHFLPGSHTPEEIASMAEGMEAYRIDVACQTADEAHAAAMSIERQRLVAILGTAEVRVFRDLVTSRDGVSVTYFATVGGVSGWAATVEGAANALLAKVRPVAASAAVA